MFKVVCNIYSKLWSGLINWLCQCLMFSTLDTNFIHVLHCSFNSVVCTWHSDDEICQAINCVVYNLCLHVHTEIYLSVTAVSKTGLPRSQLKYYKIMLTSDNQTQQKQWLQQISLQTWNKKTAEHQPKCEFQFLPNYILFYLLYDWDIVSDILFFNELCLLVLFMWLYLYFPHSSQECIIIFYFILSRCHFFVFSYLSKQFLRLFFFVFISISGSSISIARHLYIQ